MPLDWGALARGVSNGVAGYAQGQLAADQRAYERKQELERIQREKEQQAFQRMVQEHAMRLGDAQEGRAKQDQAMQMDAGGYSVWQPSAGVESFAKAGGAINNPLAGYLAGYAQQQTTQPGAPVKVRQSQAEIVAERNRQQAIADRDNNRAYEDRVRGEGYTQQDRRDLRNFAQQKELAGINNAANMSEIRARLSGQPPRTANEFTAARQLRGEFEKAIAPHRLIANAYTDLSASLNTPPSAQGDIALVFKFMKSLDPGSTVREGEYATAKNAGSIPDKIRNAYNSVMNGQFLTPEQRKQMLAIAQQRVDGMRPQLQREMERFGALAQKYQMDPADVVFDPYGQAASAQPTPASFQPRDQPTGKPVQARPPLSSIIGRVP